MQKADQQPTHPSDWTSGLCGCCSHSSTCLDGCCCPWCQTGYQVHRLEQTNIGMDGAMCCCAFLFDMFTCVPFGGLGSCVLVCRSRQMIVTRYSIDEGSCTSCCCALFCRPCAICQQSREMADRGDWCGGLCDNVPRSPHMGEEHNNGGGGGGEQHHQVILVGSAPSSQQNNNNNNNTTVTDAPLVSQGSYVPMYEGYNTVTPTGDNSVADAGIDLRGVKVQALDLVFIRGQSTASYIARFVESIGTDRQSVATYELKPHDFSHVGVVVTSDILDHPHIVPGRLYIWESTSHDDELPDIDNNNVVGVQLRDLAKVCNKIEKHSSKNVVAISQLHPVERARLDMVETKRRFTEIFKKHNGATYNFNPITLASSAGIPGSRLVEKKVAELLHTKKWLFCSQLVAEAYLGVALLHSSQVEPAHTLPMDFLGFDKDSRMPVIVHQPQFVVGHF